MGGKITTDFYTFFVLNFVESHQLTSFTKIIFSLTSTNLTLFISSLSIIDLSFRTPYLSNSNFKTLFLTKIFFPNLWKSRLCSLSFKIIPNALSLFMEYEWGRPIIFNASFLFVLLTLRILNLLSKS